MIQEKLSKMEDDIRMLKDRLFDMYANTSRVVQSAIKKKWKLAAQAETMFGMYTALVVDTRDPDRNNRVRFFTPLLTAPDTEVLQLPWAAPISTFGGFDDCGVNWIPPAGSTVCLLFESGDRDAAYYIGTTWHRQRGQSGSRFKYGVKEYDDIHEGTRTGYLVGPNDGTQVFPPWNTESYNSFDRDSDKDSSEQQDVLEGLTYPNIYGFKTPQKHMLKMVDGDYQCNHRHKRVELLSSSGCHIIMKDDHLHPAGQWCNGGSEGSPPSKCADENGNPLETQECPAEANTDTFQNPYFKQEHEQRPYKGPGTPQNNKVELKQSGIQVLSISGHTLIFDDEVEDPKGDPNGGGWERSTKDFDFGCTDKFFGSIRIVSATGHLLHISDVEKETNLRGENNFVRILSACGNRIEVNDHTKSPGVAGEKRGISMESTSTHKFEMIDTENEQETEDRKDGGTPIAKAKGGYIRLRTGYGLQIHMADCSEPGKVDGSQEQTINQNIQIYCPQKDNTTRGAHIMRFQEAPEGPGQIYLYAGGDYICQTYDRHYTIVGDKTKNPTDKTTVVSRDNLEFTERNNLNIATINYHWAKRLGFFMAGQDCPNPDGTLGPCPCPVLCLGPDGKAKISDRVWVSASPKAPCLSLAQLVLGIPQLKC